ncbi:MAG: type III polyketide synthase [Rhizobiaceae bacterium]
MNQLTPVPAAVSIAAQVQVLATATGVPPYRFSQDEALALAGRQVPGFAHMTGVFANSGIVSRYSSVPLSWYETARGWRESNATYIDNALDLLEQVATRALADAGLKPDAVDALVLVSSSGIATPSLESRLANRMRFASHAQRTPIFGLGCAGGATGLARASQIARAMPGANVLLLVVELGGLNVHVNRESAALFISTALFGDGAAALLLRAGPPSHAGLAAAAPGMCAVGATGEHMWPDTGYVMGWEMMDDGLDLVLSGKLPKLTRDELLAPTQAFLARHGLSLDDIDGYIVHPGGPKVMESVRDALSLAPEALRHSAGVLRDYGNMSAATVLFVLERTLAAGAKGRHLLLSFGPGFTASFLLLDL